MTISEDRLQELPKSIEPASKALSVARFRRQTCVNQRRFKSTSQRRRAWSWSLDTFRMFVTLPYFG
jgi:hypothetical protein